jgi:hypothetical protein
MNVSYPLNKNCQNVTWIDKLNVNKCKFITFTRSLYPCNFSYSLGPSILERVNTFTDLGVVMDSKMSFKDDIDAMIAKSMSMLGVIKRLSGEFRDPYTLKVLYVSLVRSK